MDATDRSRRALRIGATSLALLGAAIAAALLALGWGHAQPASAAGCDGTIAYGETVSCSIASAGASQSLTFPGTNHHVVRVRVIATGGSLNPISEIDKGSTTVCSATFADEFSCTLTANGTFKLLVKDGVGSGTGTFATTIQDLTAPVGCLPVPFDTTGVTGTISTAAESDCFTQTGSVGQVWRPRVVETSGTLIANLDIVRPDGSVLCSTTSIEGPCTLDVAGTYTFLVRDAAGTNTGDYRLELEKFPGPAGCTALTFNKPVNANITKAGTIKCFTFPGTGKPAVRIRAIATGGTLNPVTEGFRPDGTTVCANTFADEFNCQLDATGTHTLFVRDGVGAGTGTFTIVVQNLVAPVGCTNVPFDTVGVTGTIAKTSEMDCFTRAGTAGQVWRPRVVETGGTLLANLDIIRPDGSTLCSTTSIEGPCTLDVTGTYTFLVRDAAGTNTGDYRLELEKFPAPTGCTALTFGVATTAGITQPGTIQCFTFSGAGEPAVRIRVLTTSGTLNPVAEGFRPDGTTVCANTFADEFDCHLDATGTHTIFVRDGVGVGTGGFTINVFNLLAPTGCTSLPFDTTGVTAKITTTGQYDCFTQTGSSGQVWRPRLVETSGTLLANLDIIRPDGSVLCSTTSIEGPCTLDVTGTYTFLVRDAAGTNTGNYRLELEKFPAPSGCTALTFNSPVDSTINKAGAIKCFTFSGAGKPVVRIRALATGGALNPVTEGIRPDGTTVCANTFADEFNCHLDVTGNHTLFVRDGVGAGTGTFTIVVQNLVAPVGCTSVPFNTNGITGTIAKTGEYDCFTQTGSSGQVWRPRLVETSGTLLANLDLIRPDGSVLCSTTSIEGPCTLDVAGTYTFLVRDAAGTNSGDYRFELEKFPGPTGCTALTFGVATTAGITQPGTIQCFTFSGTGKPNVRIRVAATSGTLNPVTEGFRPDGTTVCANTFSDDFNCQLDATGTHTIFVRDGVGTGTGTASVQVDKV